MSSRSNDSSQIQWCCAAFGDWYDNAGERGFGVVVEADENGPRFFIQCRCVEPGDVGRLHVTPADLPVTLAAQIRMTFCPWCGADLTVKYAAVARELHRPELVMPGG